MERRLIERQAELETAMRLPGGIRVTEERELPDTGVGSPI